MSRKYCIQPFGCTERQSLVFPHLSEVEIGRKILNCGEMMTLCKKLQFLTIFSSDTELIAMMYIVTPTSTGRPRYNNNIEKVHNLQLTNLQH